ncbi:MAG: hypothetical protein ABIH41_04040 [Nanoarchaeota archaeon]
MTPQDALISLQQGYREFGLHTEPYVPEIISTGIEDDTDQMEDLCIEDRVRIHRIVDALTARLDHIHHGHPMSDQAMTDQHLEVDSEHHKNEINYLKRRIVLLELQKELGAVEGLFNEISQKKNVNLDLQHAIVKHIEGLKKKLYEKMDLTGPSP